METEPETRLLHGTRLVETDLTGSWIQLGANYPNVA